MRKLIVYDPIVSLEMNMNKRQFIKALGATTILGVIPGTSSLAGNSCTISGNMSGNMSQVNDEVCVTYVLGRTPGYWENHPEYWPNSLGLAQISPGICVDINGNSENCKTFESGTFFDTCFPQNFYIQFDGLTLMDVIKLEGNTDPYQLGAHAVAALLNAITFGSDGYGYSPDDVIALYHQFHLIEPEQLKQTFQWLNEASGRI